MSHLWLLFFHLISRLYERTSIRNVPLDPWRAGSFSRPPGTQAAAGGKQILSTPSLAWAYPGGEAA
jgi:hypothetical protein